MNTKITLNATATNWRLHLIRKADPAFFVVQEKVFQRDNYTCQWCGFVANSQLELINRDNNWLNNHVDNLATACPFCAQCSFLEAVGQGDFGGGALVYLPDMSQAELNALCHVLFLSMFMSTESERQANNLYKTLRLQSQVVEQKLGEGFSNPAILGKMMIEAEEGKNKGLGDEALENVRLLPSFKRFAKELELWSLEAIDQMAAL